MIFEKLNVRSRCSQETEKTERASYCCSLYLLFLECASRTGVSKKYQLGGIVHSEEPEYSFTFTHFTYMTLRS